MRAIIIAGGLGTRMRPLTYNRPKPVVPVANKPFLLHQIELLKRHGISEIVINLHYLSDSISLILGDGSEYGAKIHYSIEKKPLGTAGAVKNAEEFFDKDPLIVFNGDVLTDIDISGLIKVHKEKNAKATIALTRVEDPTPFGLVLTDESGRVSSFLEKPNWEQATSNNINAGIYILDPGIFKNVPKDKPYSFERELFPKLLEAGEKMYGVVSDAYWIDIGSPSKYLQAHRDILQEDVFVIIDGNKKFNNCWISADAAVSSAAKLHGPLIIGKNANIHAGSRINPFAVIGESVRISEGAVISESVILRNSIIGRDVKLHECIIGENCIIEDFVEIGKGVVLADYSIVKKGSQLT